MITAERLVYDLPSVSHAAIAPNGLLVSYILGRVSRDSGKTERRLIIIDRTSGERRILIEQDSIGEAAWFPDSTTIMAVISDDADHPHAIVAIDVTTGEMREVKRHLRKPSSLAVRPDGGAIAYAIQIDPENSGETPRDPDAPATVRVTRRIDYKQDGQGWVGEARSQIVIVDLGSGVQRTLTSDAVDHDSVAWSPDGQRIVCRLPNRNGILARLGVIDVRSGDIEVFGEPDGEVTIASFAPDSEHLFMVADPAWGPNMSGYVIDLQDGSTRLVLDDPAWQITGAAPVWLDQERVLLSGIWRGQAGLWIVDISSGDVRDVGLWSAMQTGLSVSDDGSTAVQTFTSIDGGIGVGEIAIASGRRTVLIDEASTFFTETPVAGWERCGVERDSTLIDAWLFFPHGFDADRTWPLIVDIHGGPHGAYGFGFHPLSAAFAGAGYAVLLVNPRGSTTYGSAFANAIKGHWGERDWEDISLILDQVVARPYIDSNRTGVFGYSYGGFMTSWILGRSDRFRAAVCGAPVFDLESFFGTSDIGHIFVEEQLRSSPLQPDRSWLERSPSNAIANAVTPTLIIHGEADERCPIGQGEQLYVSLLKLGVETEFRRYPGGAHGFISTGEPTHRLDAIDRSIAWFDHYLSGTHSPEERA